MVLLRVSIAATLLGSISCRARAPHATHISDCAMRHHGRCGKASRKHVASSRSFPRPFQFPPPRKLDDVDVDYSLIPPSPLPRPPFSSMTSRPASVLPCSSQCNFKHGLDPLKRLHPPSGPQRVLAECRDFLRLHSPRREGRPPGSKEGLHPCALRRKHLRSRDPGSMQVICYEAAG